MATDSSLPFRSARPAIEIDGRRNDTLASGLLDLQIVDSADGMARC